MPDKKNKYTDKSSDLLEDNIFNDYSNNKESSDYNRRLEMGGVPENIRNQIISVGAQDKYKGFWPEINIGKLPEGKESYYNVLKSIASYGKSKYSEGSQPSNFTKKDVENGSVGFDTYSVAVARAYYNGVKKWTFVNGVPYPAEGAFGLNQKGADIEGSARTEAMRAFADQYSGNTFSSLFPNRMLSKDKGLNGDVSSSNELLKNGVITDRSTGANDCNILGRALEYRTKISDDYEENTSYDETINSYLSMIEKKINDDAYCDEFFRNVKTNMHVKKYFKEVEGVTDEDINILADSGSEKPIASEMERVKDEFLRQGNETMSPLTTKHKE